LADDDYLIGVDNLSSVDVIIKELNAPISECMRTPVTVTPSERASSLLARMVVEDIGAIIVVEKEIPLGIITEKDVLERVIMKNRDMFTTTANDIMSKPLVTIESNRPTKEAIDLMRKHNIRRLAVTAKGALVGLVTERRLSVKFLNKIM
jgi:CBS domain-containing protein